MHLVFRSPPEPEVAGGVAMDFFQRLRDLLLVVHDYTRQAQAALGRKHKRGYDTCCRGQALSAGVGVLPCQKEGGLP